MAVDVRHVGRVVGKVIAAGRHAPREQRVRDLRARVDDGDRRAAAGRQEHVRLMAQRREAHFVPAPGAAGRLVPEAGERVVRRDRLVEEAVRHIGV